MYDSAELCRNVHSSPGWRAAAAAAVMELGGELETLRAAVGKRNVHHISNVRWHLEACRDLQGLHVSLVSAAGWYNPHEAHAWACRGVAARQRGLESCGPALTSTQLGCFQKVLEDPGLTGSVLAHAETAATLHGQFKPPHKHQLPVWRLLPARGMSRHQHRLYKRPTFSRAQQDADHTPLLK